MSPFEVRLSRSCTFPHLGRTTDAEPVAEGKFVHAVMAYTAAIELNPINAVYWANRSHANLKIENYGSAIQDAEKAIQIDPLYIKAHYRRASGYLALSKFKEALKDFKEVVRLKPNDKLARTKLKTCEKEVRRIAFESAIAVDEHKKMILEHFDIEGLAIEEDYAGPSYEGTITLEFVKEMMEYYKLQKMVHRKFVMRILRCAYEIFKNSPNVVDVNIPDSSSFTVCGDVHGQFYDLLHLFEINGLPSETNPYLFNGDFVDRGSWGVEVVVVMLAFKCLYPNHFFMNRGNHETESMNRMYGFTGEVKAKYNDVLSEMFDELFAVLPFACTINKQVFVVHGGLFERNGVTIADLNAIDRRRNPLPSAGLLVESLWSDPQENHGRAPSKRGVGVAFGPDVTDDFLAANKLKLVVRSHEVRDEGFDLMHNGKCITVFSAPNYCDQVGNKGAFVRFTAPAMEPKFTTFEAVTHPNVRPMAYAGALGGLMM
jgi:serine/threonine-protein phosphatase 5